jgi:hypothetical protein
MIPVPDGLYEADLWYPVGKSLPDYPPNTVVRDNVVRPTTEFTEKSLIDCE